MHFEDLGRALRGTGAQLWINEPMSRHTTFRVGGRAALFVRPQTREQAAALGETVEALHNIDGGVTLILEVVE